MELTEQQRGLLDRVWEAIRGRCDLGPLLERIFNELPDIEADAFAANVIDAAPASADLSLVPSRLVLDILADEVRGELRRLTPGSRPWSATERVVGLYQRRLAGEEPEPGEWEDACAYAYRVYAAAAAFAAAHLYAAVASDHIDAVAHVDAGIGTMAAGYDDAAAADARRWIADRLLHHLATPARRGN